MNEPSTFPVPACPYCGRPLRSLPNRWFGLHAFSCEQCGDFPDFHRPFTASHNGVDLFDAFDSAHGRAAERPRVLLVDDSPEHRDLYSMMLASTATVMVASRGDEGVAFAYSDPPDVVVLDVMMPGMDGWEVCRRLKANAITAQIPIIMLTSLDGVDVPARAREAGAMAVLMKPCPPDRFLLAIRAALRPVAPE